ncbi:MAG: hypothetical protein RM368_37090 [Nostoc sp. DedSLP03]|uniref:hypothetical protein n=1 Tax=Nostoc sp. DedSLP03 TaxID=3075400 RepID=UPI002AD5032A|nr:hypothetical protein [Nostoc sp. DedSLP03]MDZ7970482.1 hypothetical protein [Nostoc sp. DedSLP03]
MKLEDYFNALAPDDIRLKGTRIGIESILYEYIYRCILKKRIENLIKLNNLKEA